MSPTGPAIPAARFVLPWDPVPALSGASYSAAELSPEGDRLFLIDDVSRLGHIAIDARKQLATLRLRGRFRAVAFVGGSFEQRVMASLSYNASKLVPALESAPPFRFFDTPAEARLWLADLREAPASTR